MPYIMKGKQNIMTQGLTKTRQIRMQPDHDEALVHMARRRGSDVSALYREAVIAYFDLPTDASQTFGTQENKSND